MFKKTLLAALLSTPLAASAFTLPVQFSDVGLGGDDTFTFSQMFISSSGSLSTVTLTDANNSGFLDIGDTFIEAGLVYGVGFSQTNGDPVSGIDLNQAGGYELWAVFDPLAGYISNAVVIPDLMPAVPGLQSMATYTATFVQPSKVNIYYDTTIGGGFNMASSTLIGVASNPSDPSFCTVSSIMGATSGACELNFAFDALGISEPGVFTVSGTDVGNLEGVKLRVDMNVDQFSPAFFSPTFDVAGGTQARQLNHNGSAQFVPEPSILGLLGLGLVGLGLMRRRISA